MSIYSFTPFGSSGALVKVEVDLRRGIPAIDIVGLADTAIRESRERMQAAIRNSGLEFPKERILISLSPADLKKEGSCFDLGIALGVLVAQHNILLDEDILVLGELELSGEIIPIKDVLAAVSLAKTNDIKRVILGNANYRELSLLSDMKILKADNLVNAFHCLKNNPERCYHKYDINQKLVFDKELERNRQIQENPWEGSGVCDFSSVKAQPRLLRAMEIAAAGRHHMLVFGPPGCGKSMALNNFEKLLPNLNLDDALESGRLFSLALEPREATHLFRPIVRRPHQSISIEGLAGGGKNLRPGEVTLANNGVLFFDEANNFNYTVLQTLRCPMDSRKIRLSRANKSACFPADFQLILACNPCPCGNLGSRGKQCLCEPATIERYWKKLSQPLLDRIDIRVPLQLPQDFLKDTSSSENQPYIISRDRILKARIIQKNRLKDLDIRTNSHISGEEIEKICPLNEECKTILLQATKKYGFSPRAIHSIIKVARTISDLNTSLNINEKDLKEAIMFRRWGDSPWDITTWEEELKQEKND